MGTRECAAQGRLLLTVASAYFLMGVRGPALPSERGVLPQMASDAGAAEE